VDKKVLKCFVYRLAFGAAVYPIRRTRNDLRHANSPFSEVRGSYGKLEFASFGKEVLRELKEMEKVVVNGVLIAKYWYI
jgi:hypothetical protein